MNRLLRAGVFYEGNWRTVDETFALEWSFLAQNRTLSVNGHDIGPLHPSASFDKLGILQSVVVAAPMADMDRDIILPWTSEADGLLLVHHVQRHRVELVLQLSQRPQADPTDQSVGFHVSTLSPNAPPLITVMYSSPSSETPLISFPEAPHSSSPSNGIHTRLVLLKIITSISRTTLFVLDASKWMLKGLLVVSSFWALWAIVIPLGKEYLVAHDILRRTEGLAEINRSLAVASQPLTEASENIDIVDKMV